MRSVIQTTILRTGVLGFTLLALACQQQSPAGTTPANPPAASAAQQQQAGGPLAAAAPDAAAVPDAAAPATNAQGGTSAAAPAAPARAPFEAPASMFNARVSAVQITAVGGRRAAFTGLGGIGNNDDEDEETPAPTTAPTTEPSASPTTGTSASPTASPVVDGDDGRDYFGEGWLPFVSDRSGRTGLYFADLTGGSVVRVPSIGNGATNPRVSRDGRYVTYIQDGTIRKLDLKTQLVQTYNDIDTDGLDPVREIDVDGEGNLVYLTDDGRVHLYTAGSGTDYLIPTASRGLEGLDDISVSSDGRFVGVIGREDGERRLFLTEISKGQQYAVPFVNDATSGELEAFAMSDDGRAVLVSNGSRIKVVNLDTGFTENLPLTTGDVEDVAFLDGSSTKIIFERDGRIEIYDRQTKTVDTLSTVNEPGSDSSLDGDDDDRSGFGGIFGLR